MSQVQMLGAGEVHYKSVIVKNEYHNITLSCTVEVLGSRFCIILINAALRSDWPLHTCGASPWIWTCDTRPLLLV